MFKLESEYNPTGDQPQAIDQLVEGLKENTKFQTLKGVTGSGKTFTLVKEYLKIILKLKNPTIYKPLKLFGIVGMIVAIPSYTVLKVIGKSFFPESLIIKALTKNI